MNGFSKTLFISFSLKNAGRGFFVFGNVIINVGLCFTYPRLSEKRQNDLSVDIFRDKLRAESLSFIK
jgi:hypothetical protein